MMHRPHNVNAVALRTVAALEALKGLLGIMVAAAFLKLVHKNLDILAGWVTRVLHLSPEGRIAETLSKLADKTTGKNLYLLAAAALVYAALRFAEAFGLWHNRPWAEWFALISGCVYLPWEIHTLVHHPAPYKWGILVVNVVVIFYMLMLLLQARAARHRLAHAKH